MEGQISDDCEKKTGLMGTFKTLETSKEAYKAMADLEVEFIFALRDFVDENKQSFCWSGFSVRYYSDGKQTLIGLWTSTEARAIEAVTRNMALSPKIEYATITDNKTDSQKTIKREDLN